MYPTADRADVLTLCPDLPLSPLNKTTLLEPTPQNQPTSDTLLAVLRGRKTWKSQGGEPIWPVDLEAALLEGTAFNRPSCTALLTAYIRTALEKYRPEDCRETLMLGRFPRRNRFISDYIFNKTGKRRFPKQVGSRLQQLRDCCEDTRLRRLICPFTKTLSCSGSSMVTNNTLNSATLLPKALVPPHTVIYIDILPEGSPENTHYGITSSPWWQVEDGAIIHTSDHSRPLKSISPTVSFIAPSPLIAHSRFTVRAEQAVLHAETVPLVLVVDQAPQLPVFLHSEIFSSLPPVPGDDLPELPADSTTYTLCNKAVSQPDARCSIYDKLPPPFHSQKNAAMQRCDAASSFLSFPADLSNYQRQKNLRWYLLLEKVIFSVLHAFQMYGMGTSLVVVFKADFVRSLINSAVFFWIAFWAQHQENLKLRNRPK
ncbi:hypothetical protein DFH08DRAFT_820355 [Mycena albidolilacea]|uniref:TEA domain-containing protein n=1 Tax=Mycena albidolilacea TaxID=1033008 RepID=A0AAD6ZCP9_9AGAR|nr:hypothetical protein DFH08DRAFT_820355 [Mycena albidolilacea]